MCLQHMLKIHTDSYNMVYRLLLYGCEKNTMTGQLTEEWVYLGSWFWRLESMMLEQRQQVEERLLLRR